MRSPSEVFFLPGALGRTEFWHPVANLLTHPARKVHVSWPGFNGVPADASIRSIGDLVRKFLGQVREPSAIVAQSMGGVVALLAALQRPEMFTHLVLTATSGGINLGDFGAEDWRPAMRSMHPELPDWFTSYGEDLTPKLSSLRMPTLLLWGDDDAISPVIAGRRLASLFPNAELHVFPGGGHDLGRTFAKSIAPLVDRHLSKTSYSTDVKTST